MHTAARDCCDNKIDQIIIVRGGREAVIKIMPDGRKCLQENIPSFRPIDHRMDRYRLSSMAERVARWHAIA